MKEVKALMFKARINLSDLEKNWRQIFFFFFFSLFSCFFFRDSNGLVKFIQPRKNNRNYIGYISDEEDEYVNRNDSSDYDSIAADSDICEIFPDKGTSGKLLRVRTDIFKDSVNDNTEALDEDSLMTELKSGEKPLRSNRDPRLNPGRLPTPPPLMSLATSSSLINHPLRPNLVQIPLSVPSTPSLSSCSSTPSPIKTSTTLARPLSPMPSTKRFMCRAQFLGAKS